MTMLSFRVEDSEAREMKRWANELGMDRSEFLREALHRHLVRLRSEAEIDAVERIPDAESQALASVAEWGPAEDWTDWHDAAR